MNAKDKRVFWNFLMLIVGGIIVILSDDLVFLGLILMLLAFVLAVVDGDCR